MSGLNVASADASQTHLIAKALARQCRSGDCILLRGDLGAGKTTFARGFIEALCGEQEVVSPTFTLVQTYPSPAGAIWHFDLYRVKNPEEIAEIGLDEALTGGITLIEWPEIVQSRLPDDALNVTIEIGSTPDERRITFVGAGWQSRLELLKETL